MSSALHPATPQMATISARPIILPALLECDFTRVGETISALDAAGAEVFHLDVMDGHFVPNLTYGPPFIRSIRKATKRAFDAHLMIANPERYLEDYVRAGCDVVTIHIEAVPQPRPLLEEIRNLGARPGIALNPPTPVSAIADLLDMVDLVNVMGVMPGFGGQSFQTQVLEKIHWLRSNGPAGLIIEVDGGMNPATIPDTVRAGGDWLIGGSALFRAAPAAETFQELTRLARFSAVGQTS